MSDLLKRTSGATGNGLFDFCGIPFSLSRETKRGNPAWGVPALRARSFAQLVLQSAALFLVSLASMANPAQAELIRYKAGNAADTYFSAYLACEAAWAVTGYTPAQLCPGLSSPSGYCWTFGGTNSSGTQCISYCASDGRGQCPVPPVGFAYAVTAICGAGYMPDTTRTSCVAVCPIHASGLPCACDDGYKFDAAGTSCIPEQYTIALQIPSPAEVMPGASKSAYAKVTMSDGSAKSGAQVTLTLTVKPELENQLPIAYTGTLAANTVSTGSATYAGATDVYGKLPFVFKAPEAGGTHTITATCANCTNQATGTIKVPGCPVEPMAPLPVNDLCAQSLEEGAGEDVNKACPGLTDEMKKQAQCVYDKIWKIYPPIPYSKPSAAIRNTVYQNHLVEVWNKSIEIENKDLTDAQERACAAVIAHVERHGIVSPPSQSGNEAPHVQGRAIDIPKDTAKALMRQTATIITMPKPPGCLPCNDVITVIGDVQDYVNSATENPPACNLRWGGRFTPIDNVHFQLP